jgi:hypothetical protein
MKFRNMFVALGLVTAFTAGTVNAAPTMSPTNLPIDDQLLQALAAQGKTQLQIEDFLTTLSGIQVYDDHKNPADSERGDRAKSKRFWSAPYFTPSPARSVVGAEQFADQALTVLDDVDSLMESFTLQAREFLRLQKLRTDIRNRIDAIDRELLNNPDPVKRASLENLRPLLVDDLADVEQAIAAIVSAGGGGLSQIENIELRKDIARAIVLGISRIGVSPTASEQGQIFSDNPDQMATGLSRLRSRAGGGQFGLRQVIFEAGFTVKQQDALRTYLLLRPDVTTRGLPVQNVRVRPTAQTLIDQNNQHITRDAVMQIRGVNLGNGGVCGSLASCNVLIEYTDVGARTVRFVGLATDLTAALVPVTFEADVRVAEPDFVGSIFCNFKTGWTAQGRADVKDGAIIYDGDLSNKIKYDSVDSGFGGCSVSITEGDKDSAFYHILMDMDTHYRNLHAQRQQAAKQEKDAYRRQIEAELEFHRRNSQARGRGGWFSDVFGLFTSGRILLGLGGFLLGETRDFYWHTTTLDTGSMDEITVRQNYAIRGITATRKFAFDGFPLVCHTPSASGTSRVMKACPDAQFVNADTETDTGDETCAETDIFGECIDDQI